MALLVKQETPVTDTLVESAAVKPSYGTGAKFEWEGDKPIDRDRLANLFATIFDDAARYRRRFEPEIIKAFAQYHGDLWDSSKEPWQAQVHIPKPKQAVDTATAKITNALFQTEDWFDILPYIKSDDKKVDRGKKLLKWQWQKSKARGPVSQAVKNALICGYGPLKVHFTTETYEGTDVRFVPDEPLKFFGFEVGTGGGKYEFYRKTVAVKKLKFEPVLPLDIWLDPSGQGRFVIQRVKKSLSDLWDLAREQKDDQGNVVMPAIYDPEIVAKLTPGMKDQQVENAVAAIKRETPNLYNDQMVDVYEFWGDFIDPSNGVVLFKNILATFVDKRFTIRMPEANPYHHCGRPFVVFRSTELSGQVYNYGILYQGMKLSDAMDRHWNVILDKGMLQVPSVEVDAMAARNPAELKPDRMKFVPGKTWQRKGPERQIFHPVEGFQPPSNEDFSIVDRLGMYYDTSTNVNELATGQTTTTHRKTKEEVIQRVGATDLIFNDAAVFIEADALSPLLEMTYSLMVQYEDQYDDDALLRMFGDDPESQMMVKGLKTMTPEERWLAMKLDAEFRVVGITNRITQQDRMNRLMNFLRVAQADPTLNVIIDKFEELRFIMQNLDLPKNLVLDQNEAVLQALQQAQLQMIMGMAQGQGQGQGQVQREGGNPHNQATAAQADAGYAAENPTEGARPQ